MKKNVGGADKGLRLIISAALFAGAAFAPVEMWVRVVMLIFATAALLTAMFSFCPLWPLLGINTYKEPKQGST